MIILSDRCQRKGAVRHDGLVAETATRRDVQRQLTRERLLDAAVVEFQRSGTHAADINAIVKAAGVARSTFYFHFPTKEHVLLELIRRDEVQVANELGRFLDTPHDLPSVLTTIVQLVLDLESRWGSGLFHDVIGLYFSPAHPERKQWANHPLFVLLAAEIERARIRGELYDDVDVYHSAAFFLLGVYALLTTVGDSRNERDVALKKFVTSTLRSLQPVR
ncbi:TetR/AcrR family transcriptional regulator [Mycobacterium sp. pV006]|uniref:TetR/AcrR family transcriptional regulator n=1 Tax=Mycobacterium sp. pV006 TaxID=3238983 RepID=UPI00351BC752